MLFDPHEPGRRVPALAKNPADEALFARLNELLLGADLPSDSREAADVENLPLVYIVGVPRSGTTLLSQLACRHLPVGYVNNLIARFWLRPSVGIRLSLAVLDQRARDRIALRSAHGVSEGPEGPHEFGYFWRYWLGLDRCRTHHLSPEELSRVDAGGLQRALRREILATFASPVVFKNPICGFHAAFLSRLHPQSLFFHIRRDPFAEAASILESRRARFGSYETWWSLKPSTYRVKGDSPIFVDTKIGTVHTYPPAAGGDFVAEVVGQVLDCQSEIDMELARVPVRSLVVEYADLCRDPRSVIDTLCGVLGDMGTPIEPLPGEFAALRRSDGPALPPDLERRLRSCLAQSANPRAAICSRAS